MKLAHARRVAKLGISALILTVGQGLPHTVETHGVEPSREQTRSSTIWKNGMPIPRPIIDSINEQFERCKSRLPDGQNGKTRYGAESRCLALCVKDKMNDGPSRIALLHEAATDNAIDSESVRDNVVVILGEENAREELVWLLAARCPTRMFLDLPVEYFLAGSEKLTDGVLVLCDAFEKSSNVRNRSRIAIALRRGFTAVGVREKDDAAFVAAVRTWYLRNRDDVELNRAEYCSRLIHSPLKKDGTFFDDDEPSPYGLFVPKKDPPAQQPNKR